MQKKNMRTIWFEEQNQNEVTKPSNAYYTDW